MTTLASEYALSAFVAAFEDGSFPVTEFHHAEHLALAACYLFDHTDAEAASRIRASIRAYNVAHGGRNTDEAGYHETLTIFWLALVRANLPSGVRRLDAARAIVLIFAPRRDLFREFYSFDVVNSRAARLSWVSPDLPGSAGAAFSVPVWEKIRM